MALISPMPSPSGKNREQLYILRGGARRAHPAGAYDARNGLRGMAFDDANSDAAVDSIVADVLAKQFPGIEKIDVQPMQTSPRKSVVATDSARLKSLGERYPGFNRIGFA